MVAPVEDLFKSLSSLDPESLKQVQARVGFLLNPTGNIAAPVTDDQGHDLSLVLVCFNAALTENGYKSVMPLPVLLKTPAAEPFKRGAENMLLIAKEGFGVTRKTQVIKVIRLILDCAIQSLIEAGRPVSPRTLANRIADPEELVEEHFPGYRAANMLPMLVKRSKADITEDDLK